MSFFSLLRRQIVIPAGLLFVSLTSAVLIASAAHVHAADATVQNITISPATQTINLTAGTTYTGKLTVINGGTTDSTVTVYSRPYSVTDEQYDSQFEKPTTNSDIYQWISFNQAVYTVTAGQTLYIPYTVNVPANAAPGGHYGVIFTETEPHGGNGSNAVLRKQRVGSLIYAHVAGKTIQQGSLLTNSAALWQTTPPLTVTSRVQNSGNIDFQAHITLTVKDVFGSVKYKIDRDSIVLPGTTRKITTTWEQTPWFGLFKAEQSVTVLGKTSTSSHLVLIAPQWLIISLIIIVVILAGYGLLKHRKNS